jgi:hypothetical protein
MINIREIRPFAHFARPGPAACGGRRDECGYLLPAARRLVS